MLVAFGVILGGVGVALGLRAFGSVGEDPGVTVRPVEVEGGEEERFARDETDAR